MWSDNILAQILFYFEKKMLYESYSIYYQNEAVYLKRPKKKTFYKFY